jgi:hypothetical protein
MGKIKNKALLFTTDEGDDHKWSIPSAVSIDEHKEIKVRQILHHLGTFSSDEALESKILEFFAHRTALALSHARHSADVTDPSLLVLEPGSLADLLARLRFSTYTIDEQKIRPLTAQELQANVSEFLDFRPDGYALHHESKHLAILEFTCAMDSSEDWEEKKDAEKGADTHPFWSSSTPCRRGRAGPCSSLTSRLGFGARSLM